MNCPWCNGKGKRPYTSVNRNVAGQWVNEDKSYPCPECGGTGQVTEFQARLIEIELARVEGLQK